MKKDIFIETFREIYTEIEGTYDSSLPLCAAENVMSSFSKLPLSSFLQEKYIMGGVLSYDSNNNFVNSNKLYKIYNLLQELCKELYGCSYADARTLSGVNAVLTLLMSLFKQGDTILISSEESGGHGSMPKICKRLGIKTIPLPFLSDELDFDYEAINDLLEKQKVEGILICLSDMLDQPKLHKINLKDTILIYDATQVLGLIASKQLENPFTWFKESDNFVLMGATHKTIPGPTNGIIMCNNLKLAKAFDTKINPDYLRNNQIHQILSLIFTLEELSVFGDEYSKAIIENANYLGKKLTEKGFDVKKTNTESYTSTHQLHIIMDKDETIKFRELAEYYNITLNARFKQLYKGSGIRLGLQEITRYGWSLQEMDIISDILSYIKNEVHTGITQKTQIEILLENLVTNKHIAFTFDQDFQKQIRSILHNG